MKSGDPWHVKRVRWQARISALEAARRAGVSVGEWLDRVILDSTRGEPVESKHPAQAGLRGFRHHHASPQAPQRPRHRGYSEYDEAWHSRGGEDHERVIHQRQHEGDAASPAGLADRLAFASGQTRNHPRQSRMVDHSLAEVADRLDILTRQLDGMADLNGSNEQQAVAGEPGYEELPWQLSEAISKLDGRVDQLIVEARSAKADMEQRVAAADRAVADLNGENHCPTTDSDPRTHLDQARIEIADRERAPHG